MLNRKNILLLVGFIILTIASCKAQSNNKRYKGSRGGKVKHHHGFFSANDKATKKNEKFKKKNSKAGNSNKTSAKSAKAGKKRARPSYVKTFDHH